MRDPSTSVQMVSTWFVKHGGSSAVQAGHAAHVCANRTPANISPQSEGHPDHFAKTRAEGKTMTTNNTSSISWSNEMGSRGRRPFLLLIKVETITTFDGTSIPGIVVVRGTDYRKNGKWSHTTFRLELAQGVRVISGRDGWETGRFVEGLHAAVSFDKPIDTWGDVANAMGVSVPSAMAFLREWRPAAAEALDLVDVQLEALDEAVNPAAVVDTETVVVSFGGPTNRMIAEGFWKNPKSITGHDGELRLIDVEKGWVKENILVVGMSGAVLSAAHERGYHGGYVSVTVAVVPGSEVAKTEEPQADAPIATSVPATEPAPVAHATLADLQAKFGGRR